MTDYFEYISRHKRKRRSAKVIVAEKEERIRTINSAFKSAIEQYGFSPELPGLINGAVLLADAAARTYIEYYDMRRSMQASMDRIGLVKLLNPKSKDGRWRNPFSKFFVYARKPARKPTEEELVLINLML